MSLLAYGGQVLQEAADIARQIVKRESTRIRWATVASTDPLLIRYDGEDDPSIVPPQSIAAVDVGQRVAVAKYKGQALVLGTGGGVKGTAAHVATLERAEPSVPNASVVRVASFTEDRQTGECLSVSGTRIVVKRTGWVEATAAFRWDANPNGRRQVRIVMDGVQWGYIEEWPEYNNRFAQNLSTGPFFAESGQRIELQVYQDSGGTLGASLFGEEYNSNFLRVKYVGD